jgi:Arc/MetJ-type ribon-helix-helix transcriptional regulator
MKLSVSLSDADIEFIDRYAECHDAKTRSAVLREAVRLLREAELVEEYKEAFIEWEESGEAAIWDRAVADGLRKKRDEAW